MKRLGPLVIAALLLAPLSLRAEPAAAPGSPPGAAPKTPAGKAPLGSPEAPSAGPGILEPAATPAAPNGAAGGADDPAATKGTEEPATRGGAAAPDRGRAGDEASDLNPSRP